MSKQTYIRWEPATDGKGHFWVNYITADGGGCICDTGNGSNAKKHANFIATAPTMFEFIKRNTDLLDACQKYVLWAQSNGSADECHSGLLEVDIAIKAAVAKAEGKNL
jgi:hypothetical protein